MKKMSRRLIVEGLLFLSILFYALTLPAQTSVKFSGKWILNHQKSIGMSSSSGSELTLDIIQDQNSIQITETNKTPDGTVLSESKEYSLDGKEKVITEESNGVTLVTKRTGKWSADKKQIILAESVSLGPNVYTHEDVYSLSDDEKTLTKLYSETMNGIKENQTRIYDKK